MSSNEEEYESEDFDSDNGSESDLETGNNRKFKNSSPNTNKSRNSNKPTVVDRVEKPPVDSSSFDTTKLLHFIIIRIIQLLLANISFALMGSSNTWKAVKTSKPVTVKTTEKVGNATYNVYTTTKGLCGTDNADTTGSCYRMIVASNFLLAVGILYWMYLIVLTIVQLIMYCSLHGKCERVTNKAMLIIRDETFLKIQLATDLGWLFFTIISLCVGGTSGDLDWRGAVGTMVIIVFTQIGSLILGVKLYTSEILGGNIINDVVQITGTSKKLKSEDSLPLPSSGKKKNKTISGVQKERGIIRQQSSPSTSNISRTSDIKSDAASKANLRAIHDFPGATSAEGFRPERDLAFKTGDLLIMFEEIHNGEWYYGCDLQGNKGEFPKNRTEPLFQKAPQKSPQLPLPPPSSSSSKNSNTGKPIKTQDENNSKED
jgi:hypothetical protein